MAGASAKKTAKNAKEKTFLYSFIAIFASLLNLVVRIGLFHDGTSLVSLAQGGFLTFIAFLSFKMIQSSLQLGLGYSLWQDLFIINTTVQMLSLLSNWFWLVYVAVPSYGVYFFGRRILDFVFSGDVGGKKTERR